MVHPKHEDVYRRKWVQQPDGRWTKTRVHKKKGEVYGLYQCKAVKCHKVGGALSSSSKEEYPACTRISYL